MNGMPDTRPTEVTTELAELLVPTCHIHLRRTDVHNLLNALRGEPLSLTNRQELFAAIAPLVFDGELVTSLTAEMGQER